MRAKPSFYRLSSLISLLGLLTLLVGLVLMVVLKEIRIAAWAILALGVALMVAAVIVDFRRVSGAISGRRGRFSTGTTVMTSIFIGITLLINAISIGSYHRFDVTGLAQFTLTSQTKDMLAKMEIPVQAIGFFVPDSVDPTGGVGAYARNILKEYQNYTTKLTFKEIDPQESPDQAAKYGIRMLQTVVFESEKGRRLVSPEEIVQISTDAQGNQQISGVEAENAFTRAILEVTGVTQKKLYFVTGHGEANIDSDLSSAAQSLKDNLFRVENLDLMLSHNVPDDATALIIAGPQRQLSTDELAIIHGYLAKGGWVMVMLNPNPSVDMRALLFPWGINLIDGMVVDPSSSLQGSVNNLIVTRLRNVFGMTSIYFPGATALMPQPIFEPQPIPGESSETPIQVVWISDNSSIAMLSLARTSTDSWLENDYETGKTPVLDEATEIKGPLELALRLVLTPPIDANGQPIGTVPPTRLVVVGDTEFATDQNFFNGDNGDFFLNLVNKALTEGKQLISIQRKVLPFRRLIIGPEVSTFITYSSIGLLPLLVLIAGGVIWWRRR